MDSPGGALSIAQLKAREEELGRREAELAEREAALQQKQALAGRQPAWLPALLAGLRDVRANVAQVEMACESAGVSCG